MNIDTFTVLGQLATGQRVMEDMQSHLHETVKPVLAEALRLLSLPMTQTFFRGTINMDRVIGQDDLVVTTERDEIVFAQRPGRQGLTRFAKDRFALPTTLVSVVLWREHPTDDFVLITAFAGQLAPPEPWDERAEPDSLPFWNTHALVWGRQETVPGTETTQAPW